MSSSEDEDSEETEEEDELPPPIRIEDIEGEPPPTVEGPSFITWEEIESRRPKAPNRSKEERPDPDPETFGGRVHPEWRSVEQGIEKRHEGRHQAFRNRRRQANQGTYVESLKPIPITEQAELESVEKGSALWNERQALHWKLEIERMFILGQRKLM
jgi:hypothetical protein